MSTTIAASDIKALARQSWAAGDSAMTALCERALGRLDETRYALDAADRLVAGRVSQEQARAECERVIREARQRASEED